MSESEEEKMPQHAQRHVVFAGGATGGHLFPGLAVAEQLRLLDPQVRVTFAGSGHEFERRHVARAGFDYLSLRCRALPRSAWDTIRFLADNMAGYRGAVRFVRREQVDLVVGLGGYVSVPMGRAAASRDVPLVLLEQNVTPGRATRYLAPSASLICSAFAEARAALRADCPVRVTGNPIRLALGSVSTPAASEHAVASSQRRLLILGGSRGASQLNQLLPPALYKLGILRRGWKIIHQSGEAEHAATRELYGKFAIRARVVPFLHDVRRELARTTLAICRAGGTTLAELAVAGTPAVLVPYPAARDDHQRANAEHFTNVRAGVMFDTRELTGRADDQLAALLTTLVDDDERRAELSANMHALARPNAAWHVANMVRGMLRPKMTLRAG